ncbi:hypothetical protein ACFLQ1_01400 [Candidatus Auribacterota bacterium]
MSSAVNDISVSFKARMDRLETFRNKQTKLKEESAIDPDTSSKKSEKNTPFGRLVETIIKTNLSVQEKKNQIHYAKYALYKMNDDQAKIFEKNLKTLFNLRGQTKNNSFLINGFRKVSVNDDVAEIDKKLTKIEESINKSNNMDNVAEELDTSKTMSAQIYTKLTSFITPFNVDQVIKQYAENLNKEFDRLTATNKPEVDLTS